ncbi:hypothetical protein chiPu_0019869 [Chiloscyllium punctatum]|uniref:Reverse transcriptase zinc-binding domain-containing protein n=1 Tax=Chiloscyllium punctatum TaxID=137246 RepID=A0A401RTC2_CHIPU|nr:hypothetical protein [Chiloscyllium punctatum]
MSSDVVIQASFQYKGECNTDTVVELQELKVLKEIENFCNGGEEEMDPITDIQDIMPALQRQKPPNSLLLWCNLYPTRATVSRGRPNRHKLCRRCETAIETISHISGCCPFVKNARIKCHNRITDQLQKHVSKYGWTSYMEPRLFAKDGSLWKPDLILKKEQKIAVVDVTVQYENDSKAVEMAWREKSDKYKHLNAEVMELTGGLEPKHFGFIMGIRGKRLGMNNCLVKFLGIERFETFAQKTSRLTLSLTLKLLQLFNDK